MPKKSLEHGKSIDISVSEKPANFTDTVNTTGEDNSGQEHGDQAVEKEENIDTGTPESTLAGEKTPSLIAKQAVAEFQEIERSKETQKKQPKKTLKVQGILDEIVEGLKGLTPSEEDANKQQIIQAEQAAEKLRQEEQSRDPNK